MPYHPSRYDSYDSYDSGYGRSHYESAPSRHDDRAFDHHDVHTLHTGDPGYASSCRPSVSNRRPSAFDRDVGALHTGGAGYGSHRDPRPPPPRHYEDTLMPGDSASQAGSRCASSSGSFRLRRDAEAMYPSESAPRYAGGSAPRHYEDRYGGAPSPDRYGSSYGSHYDAPPREPPSMRGSRYDDPAPRPSRAPPISCNNSGSSGARRSSVSSGGGLTSRKSRNGSVSVGRSGSKSKGPQLSAFGRFMFG